MFTKRMMTYAFLMVSMGFGGCGVSSDEFGDQEPAGEENPFLKDHSNQGKEDTGYQNPNGIEVEVDLEADVEGSPYLLSSGPAALGQFALTYLRKRGDFYLESLAEDLASEQRVEWLVDGAWITAAQASAVKPEKLGHFRIRAVNAVLLSKSAQGLAAGDVFTAKVPRNPFMVMQDLGETCGETGGHIGLHQSTYWYLWDPEKPGCKAKTQDLTITVSRLLPAKNEVYPEYDQLVADGKITAVIMFGQVGDGDISEDDIGMIYFRQVAKWLTSAGYKEVTPAPLGRRFSKRLGQVTMEIDLYSPREFSGLSDLSHFANFQKAISEHEIVSYHGHSMLGASDFWGQPQYPGFYQIFIYGGCLGYEYYVQPIFKGKGSSWDNVDIVSSVVEVSVNADRLSAPVLAKIAWAVQHSYKASWKDILLDIQHNVYDATFGVSGVRDNRFVP
jgi:hypothetical protein